MVIIALVAVKIIPTKGSKSGYTGFGDMRKVEGGIYMGDNISTGTTVLQQGDVDKQMQEQFMYAPKQVFQSGMETVDIGPKMAKLNLDRQRQQTGEVASELNQAMAEDGYTLKTKGLGMRIGGLTTKYEPLRAQGVVNQNVALPRQNQTIPTQTGTYIALPAFENYNPMGGITDTIATPGVEFSDKDVPSFDLRSKNITYASNLSEICGAKLVPVKQEGNTTKTEELQIVSPTIPSEANTTTLTNSDVIIDGVKDKYVRAILG